MLDWEKQADGSELAYLPEGLISFRAFQKEDYYLVTVSLDGETVFPDDVKTFSIDFAKIRGEEIYAADWAVLLALEKATALLKRPAG